MKWDLLNLKKLKKIVAFVETHLSGSIFIEEEDDDMDLQVKIYLDELDEMKKRGLHQKMKKAHNKCYDLLDFFLQWRIWIKEYRLFKIAEKEFDNDPLHGPKLYEELLRMYNLKVKLVFFDKYSYLKQAKRRKKEIIQELELKLGPFMTQINEVVIDRNSIYKRIIKKISLKTPRHVLEDPYRKMEEILVKLG